MSAIMAIFSTENMTENDVRALKTYYADLSIEKAPCDSVVFQKIHGRNRRIAGYRTYAKEHFVHLSDSYGNIEVPVRTKLWRQGWFFRKNLLEPKSSKAWTIWYAFTKKDMIRLLDRFVRTDTEGGDEAYNAFRLTDFHEGKDIFEIAF